MREKEEEEMDRRMSAVGQLRLETVQMAMETERTIGRLEREKKERILQERERELEDMEAEAQRQRQRDEAPSSDSKEQSVQADLSVYDKGTNTELMKDGKGAVSDEMATIKREHEEMNHKIERLTNKLALCGEELDREKAKNNKTDKLKQDNTTLKESMNLQ